MSSQHHVLDLGRLLLTIKQDLDSLRRNNSSGAGTSQADLDRLLAQAERELQAKAEVVLRAVASENVVTLPTIKSGATSHTAARDRPWSGTSSISASGILNQHNNPSSSAAAAAMHHTTQSAGLARTAGMKTRAELERMMLSNPASNRDLLLEKFGVPAPLPPPAKKTREPRGKVSKGLQAPAPVIFPTQNKKDPSIPLPPVTEEDVRRYGMYHLMRSGFIPPDADLTDALVDQRMLFKTRPMTLHPSSESRVKAEALIAPATVNAQVKLDLVTPVVKPGSHSKHDAERRAAESRAQHSQERGPGAGPDLHIDGSSEPLMQLQIQQQQQLLLDQQQQQQQQQQGDKPGEALPPRTYDDLLDEFSLHQFIIRHGKAITTTPEFESFKRKNAAIWGAVSSLIRAIEDMLANYAVPFAYVDGQKLAKLAENDLKKPTFAQLQSCLLNADTVIPIMNKSGQRFKGKNGRQAAIIKIQSIVRMFKFRRRFLLARVGAKSVVVIQSHWRRFIAVRAFKARMTSILAERKTRWETMQREFCDSWEKIDSGNHIIIHLNSLSFDQDQRRTMHDLLVRQNGQMSRLCDISRSNVEVVYISPYPLQEDLLQYYNKLLQIGGIEHPHQKYKILHPENYQKFPSHMSLAQLILYSPRCLKKLKTLIRGKRAYIQPGVVSRYEKSLAIELGVPLLGPDPVVASMFGTKTGSKVIFELAEVDTAPAVGRDLFRSDSIIRGLASTIASNLEVPRWIFKIDDEFGGRGHAFLDVAKLSSYASLLEEKQTHAKTWNHPSVLEAVIRQLVEDLNTSLPTTAVICNSRLYRSWEAYEGAFARIGGLVEACPHVISGSPSVNLFIEPNKRVSILNAHDQFFSQPYTYAGAIFPQSSVNFAALRDASLAIGRVLAQKGVMGFVGIDYIVFQGENGQQRLWACDLNLRVTDTMSSFKMFNFVTQGTFDPRTGDYLTPAGIDNIPAKRHYAVADFLSQPYLATVQYNVFFGLCRQRGITFDLQDKVGTIFNIMDNLSRGYLGIICAGKSVLDCLTEITTGLQFIQNSIQDRDAGGVSEKESRVQMKAFRSILAVCRQMMEQEQTLHNQRLAASDSATGHSA